ncbi:hypothetical protein M885DRAFT_562388 [Pelagophyceae sp. CCMP2097]|nr:hypothetical protein M885DRAFT_562388 [Pelagophyceae sp. CCMP2097]
MLRYFAGRHGTALGASLPEQLLEARREAKARRAAERAAAQYGPLPDEPGEAPPSDPPSDASALDASASVPGEASAPADDYGSAPAAAALATLLTLGVLFPVVDVEIITVAAVATGVALQNNESAVSELLRSVGRLGRSTFNRLTPAKAADDGAADEELLDAAAPPSVRLTSAEEAAAPLPLLASRPVEAVAAAAEDPAEAEAPVEPARRPLMLHPRRHLRAREAALARSSARKALDVLGAREAVLRRRQTQLRASQADIGAARPAEADMAARDELDDVAAALESLVRVRVALTGIAAGRAHAAALAAAERKLRARETSLRAALFNADVDTAERRNARDLDALDGQLARIQRQRRDAIVMLAHASVSRL